MYMFDEMILYYMCYNCNKFSLLWNLYAFFHLYYEVITRYRKPNTIAHHICTNSDTLVYH